MIFTNSITYLPLPWKIKILFNKIGKGAACCQSKETTVRSIVNNTKYCKSLVSPPWPFFFSCFDLCLRYLVGTTLTAAMTMIWWLLCWLTGWITEALALSLKWMTIWNLTVQRVTIQAVDPNFHLLHYWILYHFHKSIKLYLQYSAK